ncbi:MAG: type I glyceraldehyde-3-phosphate dehydrogenase [Candidatus Doudnabacteria bacterium]|nr:type I glyceraldehyde-3-phosphate dehydrogenase [Candidatus Doudnabacteria bacterium]
MRMAINGFGRIGRQAYKIAREKGIEVVAVNDLTRADELAHLLKYDTVYGKYDKQISVEMAGQTFDAESEKGLDVSKEEIAAHESFIIVDGHRTKVLAVKDPSTLPWAEMNIDVVLECTGIFTKDKAAEAHMTAGAKKVIISAPSKGAEAAPTYLVGVNLGEYKGEGVISNGSCTTNCVSPITRVLNQKFGILKAGMTTIHSVTADQVLVDGLHDDYRRGRSAMMNIVPTTTGAAISTTEAIPQLKGKFDGMAIRVPTICGSITDFTFLVSRAVTVEEINQALVEASQTDEYRGIIEISTGPIVSSDIIGKTASAIVDLPLTKVIDGDLVKVLAWYDNEWGYSNRLLEIAMSVAN